MAENLASKYRPKDFSDVTEQSVVVDIVKNICESGEISNRNFLFIGSAGCGKAQTESSLVLTPEGYIKMKDVVAGTKVFTRYGEVAEVTDIFPQGKRPIYTIKLNDGAYFEVADNHLNVVYQVIDGVKREYVLDTLELIDRCSRAGSNEKFYIDSVTIPKYECDVKFKMNPYLGGFLCSSGTVSQEDNCIYIDTKPNTDLNEVKYILKSDYGIDLIHANSVFQLPLMLTDTATEQYTKDVRLFTRHLCQYMELSKVRRNLQSEIQFADLDTRLEFIRGYLDGLKQENHVVFSSVHDSSVISNVFRSSGYIDRINKYMPEGSRLIDCKFVHDFRKAKDLKHRREIISITYQGEENCKCIYVDNPDHTYITDYMCPTHNTTLARIIGNKLNDGMGQPIEIDAASHSGVDSVREIIDQMRSYPVGSKYKVFILDEVHSFSNQAWQSLLKTLEEQPARSVVCLCTTNPEKIPATILSRVQTFQLSKISLEGIYNRLKYIVEQENLEGRGIVADDDALLYISKMCGGGMRDGITLLDKALAYSNEVTLDNITKALGLPNYDKYFDLLNAVAKKDNQTIVTIINDVYNSGLNFVKWFEGFFGFITNIVKYIYLKDINQTMIPSTYQDKIQNYGPAHSAICLKLSNTLVKMNQELKTSQYLQEIAISYLCTAPQPK